MKKYKVLSLLQPWASLVVMGHKKIETRSWNTKYRGTLLIHASMGTKKSILAMLAQEPFKTVLKELAHPYKVIQTRWDIPRGEIIGSVNLIDTEQFPANQSQIEGISPEAGGYWEYSKQEVAFGDYTPGRYGWLLSDPVQFKEPIPAKGKLGIRDCDDAIAALVTEAMKAIPGQHIIDEANAAADSVKKIYGKYNSTSFG